jgi:protein disulfide-isomerase
LFVADFPSKKKQSETLKKQNKALSKKYGVRGFPTVLIIDAEGKSLAKTGYRKGGAAKYVKHIKSLLK